MDQLCAVKKKFFSTTLGKAIHLGLSIYVIVDMATDALNTMKFANYAKGFY